MTRGLALLPRGCAIAAVLALGIPAVAAAAPRLELYEAVDSGIKRDSAAPQGQEAPSLELSAVCRRGDVPLSYGWRLQDGDDNAVPWIMPARFGKRLGFAARYNGSVSRREGGSFVRLDGKAKLTAICARGKRGLRVRAARGSFPEAPAAQAASATTRPARRKPASSAAGTPTLRLRVIRATTQSRFAEESTATARCRRRNSLPVGFGFRRRFDYIEVLGAYPLGGRGKPGFAGTFYQEITDTAAVRSEFFALCLEARGIRLSVGSKKKRGRNSSAGRASAARARRSAKLSYRTSGGSFNRSETSGVRKLRCRRGTVGFGIAGFKLRLGNADGFTFVPKIERLEPLPGGRGSRIEHTTFPFEGGARAPGGTFAQPCLRTRGFTVDASKL